MVAEAGFDVALQNARRDGSYDMRRVILLALLAGCSPPSTGSDGGVAGGAGGSAAGGGVAGGSTAGGLTGGGASGGGTAACAAVNEDTVTLEVAIDGGSIPWFGLVPDAGYFVESSTVVSGVRADGGLRFIELAGPSGPFLVTFGAPNLPAAFVSQGEAIGLRLAVRAHPGLGGATTNVGLSLRRGNEVIAFAFKGKQLLSPVATPDFSPEGLSVSSAGVECETPVQVCGRRLFLASVSTDGGAPVTLGTGQTRAVGPFDVTVESFEGAISNGFCDLPGRTELAGVRVR